MLNFFNREKSTINSIVIPDFGWRKEIDTESQIQWINSEQTMALSISFFDAKPDLPSLKNIDAIRYFYREQISEHNGGLIQVDLSSLKNHQYIETIFKLPKAPSGMIYLASLTIPFRYCSYVIKIEAPDIEVTGKREAVISDKLFKEGIIEEGEKGYENWSSDPYDKKFNKGTLMNRSEESMYDAGFEDHPLSQARKLIKEIKNSIEFHSEIEKLKKYRK